MKEKNGILNQQMAVLNEQITKGDRFKLLSKQFSFFSILYHMFFFLFRYEQERMRNTFNICLSVTVTILFLVSDHKINKTRHAILIDFFSFPF